MSTNESTQPTTVEDLREENETLREQLEKAQAENERLRKDLEEALRSLKRQAARDHIDAVIYQSCDL